MPMNGGGAIYNSWQKISCGVNNITIFGQTFNSRSLGIKLEIRYPFHGKIRI